MCSLFNLCFPCYSEAFPLYPISLVHICFACLFFVVPSKKLLRSFWLWALFLSVCFLFSFWVDLWCTAVVFYSSRGYMFIEGTGLFPLHILGMAVTIQLTANTCIYFWVLCPVTLVGASIFMPALFCSQLLYCFCICALLCFVFDRASLGSIGGIEPGKCWHATTPRLHMLKSAARYPLFCFFCSRWF